METINKEKLEIVKKYMIDIVGYAPSFVYKLTDTPVIIYEWLTERDSKLVRWAELMEKIEKCEIASLKNLEVNYG